jgi:CheY-like chemotaxis protein
MQGASRGERLREAIPHCRIITDQEYAYQGLGHASLLMPVSCAQRSLRPWQRRGPTRRRNGTLPTKHCFATTTFADGQCGHITQRRQGVLFFFGAMGATMTNKRLLIVDDEPKFAAFVERVALGLGYDVEVTHHGADFMHAYRRCAPDVVVIDMVMPEIDGNELILWLVKQRCTADVIIITGYHPDYAINARLLAEFKGMRSVSTLSKPVSVATLRRALPPLDASSHGPADGAPDRGDGGDSAHG